MPSAKTPDVDRTALRDALASYLDDVKAHKHRHTYSGYKQTLGQFVGAVRADYLDAIDRQHVLGL